MKHSGKCYCGEISYQFEEPVHSQIICYCRECRFFSGGESNASLVISKDNFQITKGVPKAFSREDLDNPRVRYFCGTCGTHIYVESPPRPGMIVLKVGTIDDHSWFRPQMAIFCSDKQPFHKITENILCFEKMPLSK